METIFFTIFISWYLKKYHSSNKFVLSVINFFITMNDCVKYYNHLTMPEYFSYDDEDDNNILDDTTDIKVEPKHIVKYEDKYLQEVRKMDRQFNFDNNDEIRLKTLDCLKIINNSYSKRRKEIDELLSQIDIKISESIDTDYIIYNDNDDGLKIDQNAEDNIKQMLNDKNELLDEYNLLLTYLDTVDGQTQCIKQAQEEAYKFCVDQKITQLENCCVMENTPLGNVLMIYHKERETFKYYSDVTIPYRYLEVVARKYVKQFNCRPIFVDMEEEIQIAEKKKEREKEELAIRQKEEMSKPQIVEEKKNVFAKFKSYNKESGNGHVNIGAPPKNSLPNKQKTEKQEADYVLKNSANRYTYEGKIVNFSFIKKVDRKTIDKKASMSFANFKKLKLQGI
jgi:hypothetical protein